MTWSSSSIDSKLRTSGGYPCCSSTTAAKSAASRQWAAPWWTTPRKLRSVAPPGGGSVLYGSRLRKRWTARGVRSLSMSRRSSGRNRSRSGLDTDDAEGRNAAVPRLLVDAYHHAHVGEHLFGRPFVADVGLDEVSLPVDDRRAQGMRDVTLVVHGACDRHAEPRGPLVELIAVAGDEGPHPPIGIERFCMRIQHGWRVG